MGGAQGWNIDCRTSTLVVTRKYRLGSLWGVWQWNVVVVGEGVRDTLLGPEGSGGARSRSWESLEGFCPGLWRVAGWFLLVVGLADGMAVVVSGVGCRLYVENFTVDASIFVVFKFLRAHGGCLGTRNRRRT